MAQTVPRKKGLSNERPAPDLASGSGAYGGLMVFSRPPGFRPPPTG